MAGNICVLQGFSTGYPRQVHRACSFGCSLTGWRVQEGIEMLTAIISAFFVLVGGFAVLSMVATDRRYAGAWDRLALEREALRRGDAEPDAALEAAGTRVAFPRTVTVRRPAEAVGAVVYQRRFTPRAAAFPLQCAGRAAA